MFSFPTFPLCKNRLVRANVSCVNLIDTVKAAIDRERLIPDGVRVLVGVSGGADSVALLHVLYRLYPDLIAVHLNHCIRGADADADEQFVKDLCAGLGVECVSRKVDVPSLAEANGISLEMAARDARHDFFRTVISDLCPQTSVLCLAHHADDQLETFFLRAARGTGPAGLGGMRPSQQLDTLTLCRPLLGVRRAEIVRWLEEEGIAWREDASNADAAIPRNRVRHQILPVLGDLNERAAENILRTMEILRDEQDLPEIAAVRRAARDRLIEFGVSPTFDAVERFVEFSEKKNGTSFLDLEGVRLVNEYGTVHVDGVSPPRSVFMEEGVGILRGKWEASVSLKKIAGREVTVRTPQPGDRMNPYGMTGSKKLQDIFTDLKISKVRRAVWPVVECGGEILWVPGYRIARGWELAADEERALHLKAVDEEEE